MLKPSTSLSPNKRWLLLAVVVAVVVAGCGSARSQAVDTGAPPPQTLPEGVIARDPQPAPGPAPGPVGSLDETELLSYSYVDAYGETHDVTLRSDGAYYVHISDDESSFSCDRAYNPATNTLTSYCSEPDQGPEAVVQYQQRDVASSGVLSHKYPDVLPADIRAPFLASAIAAQNPATGQGQVAVVYPDVDGGDNDVVIEMAGRVDLASGLMVEATDAAGPTVLLSAATAGGAELRLADDLDARISALERRYVQSDADNETTRGQEQINLSTARSRAPELASAMPETLAGLPLADVFHEAEDAYGAYVLVYRRGVQELVVTIRPLFADESAATASLIDPYDEFGAGLPNLSGPGSWSEIVAHPLYPEHFWTLNDHARITVESYLAPADVLQSARVEMVNGAGCGGDVCVGG